MAAFQMSQEVKEAMSGKEAQQGAELAHALAKSIIDLMEAQTPESWVTSREEITDAVAELGEALIVTARLAGAFTDKHGSLV